MSLLGKFCIYPEDWLKACATAADKLPGASASTPKTSVAEAPGAMPGTEQICSAGPLRTHGPPVELRTPPGI
jgi:hypothetical protein